MKDSEKIKITENDSLQNSNEGIENSKIQWEKLKKPIIYFLMVVVCLVCFYLIFKPKANIAAVKEVGLNAAVPQAKDGALQSDKQKAYEEQLLQQKNEEQKSAMTTLSDYWSDHNAQNQDHSKTVPTDGNSGFQQSDLNAVSSYRNARQTLGSFYGRDQEEVNHLKKEISRLKSEASPNSALPAGLGMNDQLNLMEKSYQMAAKYFPTNTKQEVGVSKEEHEKSSASNMKIIPAKPLHHSPVSTIYREPSDSALIERLNRNRFYDNQNDLKHFEQSKNTIKGVVDETKTLFNESSLSIKLTEGMQLGHIQIPAGSLLIAGCKFQGGRLQLKISTVQYKGNVYPVEINVHDNDGQAGLYAPYSPEQTVVSDIVANMSQTSGTNIMMTQSAGQQVTADLTRGAIQGLSGYFQKKVRRLKITVKAGHQVLLVPKNN